MTAHVSRADRILRLEERIEHHFENMELLELALTHSSYANEEQSGGAHNERLEFLGDAVLELCVSHVLYHLYPMSREGELTKVRAALVSTSSLASLARELKLDELLKLGRGEELQGGRQRDSVLSDTFEAVLAAVYEDGGFQAAQRSVNAVFATHWKYPGEEKVPKDNKTRLQELVRQRFKAMPVYTQTACSGPDHARTFTVELTLPDGRTFSARGSSTKKAEQEAARCALTYLGSA